MSTLERPLVYQCSGLAVGTLAILFLGFLPLLANVRADSDELHEERAKEALALQERQNTLITERQYEQLSAQAQEIDTFFVDESSILNIVNDIEKLAQTTAVVHTIEQLSQPTSGNTTSHFVLSVTGAYSNVVTFLHGLEAFDVYINISDITMATSTGTTNINAVLKASLTWRS